MTGATTGHHGRYLRFDLTSGQGEHIALPAEVQRRYIGGAGLGAWLLQREAPVGVDPLAPEAPLVFAFSPLVGTSLTTSAKLAVVAKSPLTGFISDGLSGSWFAITRSGWRSLCGPRWRPAWGRATPRSSWTSRWPSCLRCIWLR